jgi:DNA repair exonuclease SbcCD nuclease subunit
MPRFLHIADIHLGFDRYDNKVRTQDFFYTLMDVVERYAIRDAIPSGVAPQVDFVLIAGDLFEHRNLQPHILNQAQAVLSLLKDAGIPVLAIEGNHDNRPYGVNTSWLRYLADWEMLYLLEPGDVARGEPFYSPWDAETKHGGYIDLPCGVRVLGSSWYGSTAPKAIEQIAAAIGELPPAPGPTVLLFHHGLEGQIARYQGALRYSDLLPLKQAGVDYLALGHIHKNYEIEGWVFNPGSLEANSIDEARFERGAYVVDIGPDGIRAELKRDYRQRPILRIRQSLRGSETVEEVEQTAIALVQQAISLGQLQPDTQPIVELRLEGEVGFERTELDVRSLQQQLQSLSNALIFLLKFEADVLTFASPLGEEASRDQVEREVFLDLLTANSAYKNRAPALAQGLIDLKNRQLEGRSEPDLYELVQSLLTSENSERRD